MIPTILFRTVPADTTDEVEGFWKKAQRLHPSWTFITYRDPLDPDEFPLTSARWGDCSTGAQLAGLIRLEVLWGHGGVYIDSDVELYRPLDSLTNLSGFAGWEDTNTIPDAVLGFEARHPAVKLCIEDAMASISRGAWESGPGVTTRNLQDRPDVLLFPPGSFYPYHYSERDRRHEDHQGAQPWAFCAHHWHASWLGGGS